MNPTKLQSLLLFILENLNRDVGSIELAKILYLVDAESVFLVGHSVSGEEYTRQKKGPLARNFQNALDSMDGFEATLVVVPTRSGIPKNSHSIGKKPRFVPKLDETDILAASRVLKRISGVTPLDLEKLAYDTEPMKIIASKEIKLKKSFIGEILDLNSIVPHPVISKWRENMKIKEKPDPKYEEFLKRESKEIDNILASLG
jgi:hypothetical protein